ncbi:MAG: twin-arginine translocase TatA/TatE family subunit [Novosphingobium sp.]
MGGFSLVHWAVVVIAAMLLFGSGRIARTMGDFGQGLRAFRKGLSEDEPVNSLPAPQKSED